MNILRKYPEDITRSKIKAWCDKAERSEQDVRKKLKAWHVPEEEQAVLIKELIQLKLMDESRFAHAFAYDRFEFRKWGERKIEQALYLKGVPRAIIQEALASLPRESMNAQMFELVKKKWEAAKGLDPYKRRAKVIRQLLTRGYRIGDVSKALRLLGSKENSEE